MKQIDRFKEQIECFFKGAIVEGVSREVVFPPYSEEGYLEVELVAPPQCGVPIVHLSIPVQETARSRCIVCGQDTDGKPACMGCWDEAIAQGLM